MTYENIKAKLLRDNRLQDTAKFLEASEDEVYCADRHVLHSDREHFKGLDMPIRDLGVLLGLDLLRDWTEAAEEIRWLFISKPFLTIDSDWLNGVANAAPPSVVVCLAKSPAQLDPMKTGGTAKQPDFDLTVPADLSGLDCRYTTRASDDEVPPEYAWCIRVDNGRYP